MTRPEIASTKARDTDAEFYISCSSGLFLAVSETKDALHCLRSSDFFTTFDKRSIASSGLQTPAQLYILPAGIRARPRVRSSTARPASPSSVSPFNHLPKPGPRLSIPDIPTSCTRQPARLHPRTNACIRHDPPSKAPRATETSPSNEPCPTLLRTSSRRHRTKEVTSNLSLRGEKFEQVAL